MWQHVLGQSLNYTVHIARALSSDETNKPAVFAEKSQTNYGHPSQEEPVSSVAFKPFHQSLHHPIPGLPFHCVNQGDVEGRGGVDGSGGSRERVGDRWGGGGGGREREGKKGRQAGRQTGRQTERQRERERNRGRY